MGLVLTNQFRKLLYLSRHFENVVLPDFEIEVYFNKGSKFLNQFLRACKPLEEIFRDLGKEADVHASIMIIRPLVFLGEVLKNKLNRCLARVHQVNNI